MPINAQLHDGRTLEFPDGTDPAVIQATVKRLLGQPAGLAPAPAGPLSDSPKFATFARGMRDLMAGGVRGAGSIGATLLAPVDIGSDLMAGKGWTLDSNRKRRDDMDAALSELGADTNSLAYKGGKLGGEIAGTAGVGGVLANGARALGASAPVVNALSSAGFTSGAKLAPGAGNALSDVALRTAAGGVVGGASTALADPESAGTGAAVGAALPGAFKLTGVVGNKLSNLATGPAQSADFQQAITAARGAGYVIPPTQARPTLPNRLMEGLSGKITTAQNASAKNAEVTTDLAASALGLPAKTKITPEVLSSVREQAGKAYESVAGTGTVTMTPAYDAALDKIVSQAKSAATGFPNAAPNPVIAEIESLRTGQADARAIVDKIKELRDAASSAYGKQDKSLGSALKSAAAALEDALDGHLQQIGAPQELLQGLRDARQLIAKTYTVQGALNPTTGAINARKIGSDIARGKPITGDLQTIGDFANRFPKAAQTVENMGSLPQTSPLDWHAGAAASLASGNPLGLLVTGARPLARSAILSPMVQNRLIQNSGGNALQSLLANPAAAQLLYRSAPAALAGR